MYRMIDAARFSPIAMFSLAVPRSSVCPSITTTEPGCSLSQRTTLSSALMSSLPTVAWPGWKRTATSAGSLEASLDNGAAGVAVATGAGVGPAGSVGAGVDVFQNCHDLPAHPPKAITIVSDATANTADRVPPRIVVLLPFWFRPPPQRGTGALPGHARIECDG